MTRYLSLEKALFYLQIITERDGLRETARKHNFNHATLSRVLRGFEPSVMTVSNMANLLNVEGIIIPRFKP